MTSPSTHADLEVAHDLAIRDFRLMENWSDAEATAIIAPSMVNEEAMAEPPAARAPGVAGQPAWQWLQTTKGSSANQRTSQRPVHSAPRCSGWVGRAALAAAKRTSSCGSKWHW